MSLLVILIEKQQNMDWMKHSFNKGQGEVRYTENEPWPPGNFLSRKAQRNREADDSHKKLNLGRPMGEGNKILFIFFLNPSYS